MLELRNACPTARNAILILPRGWNALARKLPSNLDFWRTRVSTSVQPSKRVAIFAPRNLRYLGRSLELCVPLFVMTTRYVGRNRHRLHPMTGSCAPLLGQLAQWRSQLGGRTAMTAQYEKG